MEIGLISKTMCIHSLFRKDIKQAGAFPVVEENELNQREGVHANLTTVGRRFRFFLADN